MATVHRGVAENVVYTTFIVKFRKSVSVAYDLIGVGRRLVGIRQTLCRTERIRSLLENVSAFVVAPSVSLVELMVVFSDQSVPLVIVIL